MLDWSVLNWCVLSILIGQIAGDQTYSQKMPRAPRPRVGRAAPPCVSRLDAGWGGGLLYTQKDDEEREVRSFLVSESYHCACKFAGVR